MILCAVSGGVGIDQLVVVCTSLQEKSKWLNALKPHVRAMNASVVVKPQHLQVHTVNTATTRCDREIY